MSRYADGTNVVDLVVSSTDLPCPPASRGAYSFEFNFVPQSEYFYLGEGQINVFKINGALPPNPIYNNNDAITGSLIGTFELPERGTKDYYPKVISIN